jgi:uncharacterized protein (TIGR02271 family)
MADRQKDTRTIPITEEELVVGRRTVDLGAVRVSKTTETRQVIVDDPIVTEEVHVERRRIDRPVSSEEPPVTRTEGDTTIFPVLEEVVVVEKRLILREEIRVTRIRQERPSSQEIAVKREQLHVERLPAEEHASPGGHTNSGEPDQQERDK